MVVCLPVEKARCLVFLPALVATNSTNFTPAQERFSLFLARGSYHVNPTLSIRLNPAIGQVHPIHWERDTSGHSPPRGTSRKSRSRRVRPSSRRLASRVQTEIGPRMNSLR
jgi:hypothetical protein